MARAFLDLGTNVRRSESLICALQGLGVRFRVVQTSSVYESPAAGPPGQPEFWNMAVEIETELPPEELRLALRSIEAACGRVRTADKYAPRTVDLDLTLMGDHVHPQVASEAFVLVPLAEIAGDLEHPALRVRLRDLAAGVDGSGLRRVPFRA